MKAIDARLNPHLVCNRKQLGYFCECQGWVIGVIDYFQLDGKLAKLLVKPVKKKT